MGDGDRRDSPNPQHRQERKLSEVCIYGRDCKVRGLGVRPA